MNPLNDPMVAPKDFAVDWQHEPSDWRCLLLGGKDGIIYRPAKGREPNRFHWLMQRLILGFKWERISDAARPKI